MCDKEGVCVCVCQKEIETGTETQRHRDTETLRHSDTETQRHRDTEIQRHRDTETQRQRERDRVTERKRERVDGPIQSNYMSLSPVAKFDKPFMQKVLLNPNKLTHFKTGKASLTTAISTNILLSTRTFY